MVTEIVVIILSSTLGWGKSPECLSNPTPFTVCVQRTRELRFAFPDRHEQDYTFLQCLIESGCGWFY